jgi:hypothetical protein
MEFLSWLEQTGYATFVRESPSYAAYSGILFLHTLGLSLLAGSSGIVDLMLLGISPRTPLKPVRALIVPMWIGFWLAAFSGVSLFMADATTKAINPVFYIKLIFIAGALIILRSQKRHLLDSNLTSGAVPGNQRVMAFVSLLLWIGATTAGRLLAYIGPVSGLSL